MKFLFISQVFPAVTNDFLFHSLLTLNLNKWEWGTGRPVQENGVGGGWWATANSKLKEFAPHRPHQDPLLGSSPPMVAKVTLSNWKKTKTSWTGGHLLGYLMVFNNYKFTLQIYKFTLQSLTVSVFAHPSLSSYTLPHPSRMRMGGPSVQDGRGGERKTERKVSKNRPGVESDIIIINIFLFFYKKSIIKM